MCTSVHGPVVLSTSEILAPSWLAFRTPLQPFERLHSLELERGLPHPLHHSFHSFVLETMSTSQAEGRREDALVKQRTQMREEYERQKQNLINETEKARPSSNRFVGQNDSMEDTLKKSTVGLVRLEDFQQRRKELEEAKAREAARTSELKYVTFCFHYHVLLCVCLGIPPAAAQHASLDGIWMTDWMWSICLGMNREG